MSAAWADVVAATAGAGAWITTHPVWTLGVVAGLAFFTLGPRLANLATGPHPDVRADLAAAVLTLVEADAVSWEQDAEDLEDAWMTMRFGLAPDGKYRTEWFPMADALVAEALDLHRAGLIRVADYTTSVELTDEGRAELRLHRYPRPARRERVRAALRYRLGLPLGGVLR